MKIAIFTQDKNHNIEVKGIIESKLNAKGFEIDEKNPDFVIYVGGDGTFLRAVNHYVDRLESITFIGVKTGTLGFFYEYNEKDIDLLISDLEKENFTYTQHGLIEFTLIDGEKPNKLYAVNEVRIENPLHTLTCKIDINGDEFEDYRGNGLIVSSSLGSSGYNKSLGGPIVLASQESLILTSIAPIHNRVYCSLESSLVVDKNSQIMLETEFSNVVIGYDHLNISNPKGHNLLISLSKEKVLKIAHRLDFSYSKLIKRTFLNYEK